MRRYRAKYPERCRADLRRSNRRRRVAALQLAGGKCKRCGFTDWRALQFDHINGGGTKARGTRPWDSRFSTYGLFLQYAATHPTEFQILCANCNWIKRYEKGEEAWKIVSNSGNIT